MYALLQFVVHVIWLGFYVAVTYAMYVENAGLAGVIQIAYKYLGDVVCFSSPIFLFSMRLGSRLEANEQN